MKDDSLVRDPVCGMIRSAGKFSFSVVYNGGTYYFCSDQCKQMFEAVPRGYVKGEDHERG